MNIRFAGAALLLMALCGCKHQPVAGSASPASTSTEKDKITDSVTGTGDGAAKGDHVWVIYTGKLTNGTTFDSNVGKEPFAFEVGAPQTVIEGWQQGILGMKVGGKRHLSIPASLGYGDVASEKIPAGSRLEFDIELLHITKPGDDDSYAKKDVTVGTGPAAKAGDTIKFHYKASYIGGRVFDDSEKRPAGSAPIEVKLGQKLMVPALEYGLVGMQPGGVRIVDAEPGALFGMLGNGTMKGSTPVTITVKMISVNGSTH